MFELFLFINPIGLYCYDVEQQLRKAEDELEITTSVHYLPILTTQTMSSDISRRRCASQMLSQPTAYSLIAENVLHDFHAIKMAYGNKKARRFLYTIQGILSDDALSYQDGLPRKIAESLGIDWASVELLRNSKYIEDSLADDIKLAEQWQIRENPSTVIFNEANDDSGILLEGKFEYADLLDIFTQKSQFSWQDQYPVRRLRLI